MNFLADSHRLISSLAAMTCEARYFTVAQLQTVELVRRRLIHMREVTNGTEDNQGIL